MRALSIRQPYVELILRGIKTAEYRSRPTRIVGERFYLYASLTWAGGGGQGAGKAKPSWSGDLAVPAADDADLPWMLELAEGLRLFRAGDLPTGVIVGTAQIVRVEAVSGQWAGRSGQWAVGSGQNKADDPSSLPTAHRPPPTLYAWHLADVERLATPRRPTRHPQPTWFWPFEKSGQP